jgi:hypothetical protein
MWLVTHNQCWTVDCLARRGLQHPDKCLFCDQEDENLVVAFNIQTSVFCVIRRMRTYIICYWLCGNQEILVLPLP